MANIVHFPRVSYVDGNVQAGLDLAPWTEAFERAQAWLGDRVLEDCRSLMPLLTGNLQQRSTVLDGGRQVIFPGPYARYQYGGVVMVNSATGRGPRKIEVSPGEYILRFPRGARLVPTSRPLNYSNPAATDHWFDEAKARYGAAWIQGVKDAVAGRV